MDYVMINMEFRMTPPPVGLNKTGAIGDRCHHIAMINHKVLPAMTPRYIFSHSEYRSQPITLNLKDKKQWQRIPV